MSTSNMAFRVLDVLATRSSAKSRPLHERQETEVRVANETRMAVPFHPLSSPRWKPAAEFQSDPPGVQFILSLFGGLNHRGEAPHQVQFSCRALFSRRNYSHDSIDLALFAGATDGFRKVLNHHNCESATAHRRCRGELNLVKRAYLRGQADKLASLEDRLLTQSLQPFVI
jgi:hypothetical protein